MSIRSTTIRQYTQPHQFEPLLPQTELEALAARSRPVVEMALALRKALSPATLASLRELVRAMNSYYSNTIEGQGTHPANIARALRAEFSEQAGIAQRQRIALAHIAAERKLEARIAIDGLQEGAILRPEFLLTAHRMLYGQLAEADRRTEDGHVVAPGELRREDVAVGRHQPPAHAALPAFLTRMDEVYGRVTGLDPVLYAVASAHHRAAWVHPFRDGNGRACRLQTHCALYPLSQGLWSVNRGLARDRETYYAMLDHADMVRQGDLDGRGNLSERALREWCEYFIDVCADQVRFLAQMFELEGLKGRIADLVHLRGRKDKAYDESLVMPLYVTASAGPITRGQFQRMTGMPERTARRALARLLKDGLLVSESDKAPVSFNFPLDTLNILLPNLYPEAATTNLEF
ncbi:MAG: Fic family protein [Rhodocyclaceae bacterium]|nr:Fic family protein [Rhodocyclaceae bacterium]